jgi:hypothetical protein
MKTKIHKRTFSISEINHLLTLLKWNEEDCVYYGNKEQYWKRHESICKKLKDNEE